MIVDRTCPICRTKQSKELDFTDEQYTHWRNGMVIQKAMPQLSVNDREFLMTGICNTCWEKM